MEFIWPKAIELIRGFVQGDWNVPWERLAQALVAHSSVEPLNRIDLGTFKASVRDTFFKDVVLERVTVEQPQMRDRIKKMRWEDWNDKGWPDERLQRVLDLFDVALYLAVGRRFPELASRENPFIQK